MCSYCLGFRVPLGLLALGEWSHQVLKAGSKGLDWEELCLWAVACSNHMTEFAGRSFSSSLGLTSVSGNDSAETTGQSRRRHPRFLTSRTER